MLVLLQSVTEGCCSHGAARMVLLQDSAVRVLRLHCVVAVARALWSWLAGAAAECRLKMPDVCILRNLGAATGTAVRKRCAL